jgi:hypothetical protein
MKRIAHISNGTITNVSMARDDYTPDGITQMLESDALAAGLTYATRQEEPMPVIVTMTSLRLALIDAGLYQTITSAINGIEDATEKLKAQTWWSTAQTVRRVHPLVAGIAALAGKTDAQVDAIFAAAQALDNPTP